MDDCQMRQKIWLAGTLGRGRMLGMSLITTANAREMSAKANASRWSKWRADKAELVPADSNVIPAGIPEVDSFRFERLQRVREHLRQIDTQIAQQTRKPNPDGQTLNWLCTAQARLSEQERVLAGRPMPGSLRPSRPGRQRGTTAEPVVSDTDTPQPVVSPEDNQKV